MTHHYRGTHTLPASQGNAGLHNYEPDMRASAAKRGSDSLVRAMLVAFDTIAVRNQMTLTEAMWSQLYPGVIPVIHTDPCESGGSPRLSTATPTENCSPILAVSSGVGA